MHTAPRSDPMPTFWSLIQNVMMNIFRVLTLYQRSAEHFSEQLNYLLNLTHPPSELETTALAHCSSALLAKSFYFLEIQPKHSERTYREEDSLLGTFTVLFHLNRLVPTLPSLAQVTSPTGDLSLLLPPYPSSTLCLVCQLSNSV